MSYPTYFEIGGKIVESHVAPVATPRPALQPLYELGKEKGLSKRDVDTVTRTVKEDTGIDLDRIGKNYSRWRRVKWATTTAGVLAGADGPLPVGDALAIGFLSSYAVYEIGMIAKDVYDFVSN